MKHIIDARGHLTFVIEDDRDRETLTDIKDRVGGDDIQFLDDMLDQFGLRGNGVLYGIRPTAIGALMDAPMLSDYVEYLNSGDMVVRGNVWWYPNYMILNFAEQLLERGQVTFRAAT